MGKTRRVGDLFYAGALIRCWLGFRHTFTELLYRAGHEYAAAVPAVSQSFARVATNDEASAMHHESAHEADVASY